MISTVNLFSAGPIDGRVDIGALAKSSDMAVFAYDIGPGESSSPYHYEYVEEWLLVVSGAVVVRTPEGEGELARGELVRFAAGPAGAHKIMNRGGSPSRILLMSHSRAPAVSVYPDSNKVGVWSGPPDDAEHIFVRDTAVPWSHGEDGWNRAD